MKLYYETKGLEKKLSDERLIKKYFGNLAKNLSIRLAELEAANTLADIPQIPPPRCHRLLGKRNNQWGIWISNNYRLIVIPIGECDLENLSTVKAVKIVDIVDYH